MWAYLPHEFDEVTVQWVLHIRLYVKECTSGAIHLESQWHGCDIIILPLMRLEE